jgi:D-alanyl-D-alanine dipeptidase
MWDMRRPLLWSAVFLFFACSAFGQADASRQNFHITPLKPVEELRREALEAQPPAEQGKHKPDLVEVTKLDRSVKLDIRYASDNNFMATPFYSQARAFLQRPAAQSLIAANRELHKRGYGILIHDAYRPWYVTKMFWDATPDDKKKFVADPAKGSMHNRGCAADVSLYDTRTGHEVAMPSGYDEMSDRAYPNYSGGTADERSRRDLLREVMEKNNFTVYEFEWWHFDYKDCTSWPIGNVPFEKLSGKKMGDGATRHHP